MAYTATVTVTHKQAFGVPGPAPLKILIADVNITSYHATLAEITGVTKFFRGTPSVWAQVSDEGYVFEWVAASKAFKVYRGDYSNASDGPLVEAANDADVGNARVLAVGV